MTYVSTDVEHIARAFPSPDDSKPARSLIYQCGGHIHRAVIGQPRALCDDAGRAAGRRKANQARRSGTTVLSIIATPRAVEIWTREPTRGWPNPSIVDHDAVLSIDYLDCPSTVEF